MLRTNFNKRDLPKYKRAIIDFKAKTGIDRLYIEEKAYCGDNQLLVDAHALHDNGSGGLKLFWEIFNNINIITDNEMFDNMQYYMEYCQKNEYITPQEWLENKKHF